MECLITQLAFFSILGAMNPRLFEYIDNLYIKNRIQNYFRLAEFQILKKKFVLWSWNCDPDKTLQRFPCGYEVVREIELFMKIHVTKQINVDAIALAHWVLEQYYPDSKQ